jgi:hypothetical protein
MAKVEIPNFGALLGEFIAPISAEGLPGFLAGLEREAAARYRGWAKAAPSESAGLLACAGREDEIANRIEARFPMPEADRSTAEKNLPEARRVYFEVFVGLSLRDQLTIQANAERQGAQAWRGMLDSSQDETIRDVLAGCATLEEETADHLDALLANSKAELGD